MSEILDAIMHAVRATQRRLDGLPAVADLHSAASRRCLAQAVSR